MDRLPPELKMPIMQQVIEESPPGIAGALAAVSREWQALIEPTSFATLRLNQECLAQARKILTPVRQSYVRCIDFTAALPCYDPKEPETETERQQNNEDFSNAMASLLGLLSTWSGCRSEGIELSLRAASATDKGRCLDTRAEMPPPHSKEWKADRCISSFVGLRDDTFHQRLPEVPIVREFTCARSRLAHRRLVPRTCCELASRFPRLDKVHWFLADGGHDHAYRVQQRRDFAAALLPSTAPGSPRLIPESFRHLELRYGTNTIAFKVSRKFLREHPDYYDYVVDTDPVLCPEGTPDDLSLALAALSTQLVSADLKGTVGEEFWSSLAPEEKQGDYDEKKKNDKEAEEDSKGGHGDGGAGGMLRHHQTLCRLRRLCVTVGTHTPQGIFHYRYDPKVDPRYMEGRQVVEDPPMLKIDPAWTAARRAAQGRVPGMEGRGWNLALLTDEREEGAGNNGGLVLMLLLIPLTLQEAPQEQATNAHQREKGNANTDTDTQPNLLLIA
ncbi:hypothetical protein PG984_016097 [Apiospora sp. TS-2023a]